MLRIGICQVASTANPGTNLDLIDEWTAAAARAGARVVLFPEATMAHFGVPSAGVAQPLSGPWARSVASLASAHGVVIVTGMFTPAVDGRVHNTVLITGQGHHYGYRKIHLYDAFGYRESATISPGTEALTWEVDGVTLGVATCYDVRFPALFQRLAASGTSAVLLPASWATGDGKLDQWELLVRARALDSGNWILGCDQADPGLGGLAPENPRAPRGIGYSLAADPFGRVVSQLGPEPALLTVDIDPKLATQSRTATGSVMNRVPELF